MCVANRAAYRPNHDYVSHKHSYRFLFMMRMRRGGLKFKRIDSVFSRWNAMHLDTCGIIYTVHYYFYTSAYTYIYIDNSNNNNNNVENVICYILYYYYYYMKSYCEKFTGFRLEFHAMASTETIWFSF